jgi:23S rRNA (cytosine1962-C5)-methyltransferase
VPSVVVPDRLTPHVAAGHPWLYADAFPGVAARTGDIVTLLGAGRRKLGVALYDADSPIALRVLATRKAEPAGPALWRRRIADAWALRRTTLDLSATDAFRALHGEGDRLPGVVVDHYAGFLIIKLDTPAWLPHLPDLTAALVDTCHPRGIFYKGLTGERSQPETADKRTRSPDATDRRARSPATDKRNQRTAELEPDDSASSSSPAAPRDPRVLYGEDPPELIGVREHGMRFLVDVRRGQKTGLFLDQRDNRALVRQVARGRSVLNLFAYTGGFSLAAALGGAAHVTTVDIARPAVDAARVNFQANDLDPAAHAFAAADAFDHLEACAAAQQTFDLVIVDPPSFAPRKQAVPAAEAAYARLNAAAIRQVRPGGLVACASCSSHIPMDMFLHTILREAARQARRTLRVLEVRHEPADHPSPLHFPEGRYLKFVLAVAE